ncbi:MAG: enoyl-CoA hydratase [Chloroflexi bacterium]|jgi:enoyl-CoA hydratase/carnithine racemase|nr:enoyl-CoA hydratase [Chloroflexota bacterium]MBT4074191.1 enoyl-CoA hydratase [Chloroflexota bacterium]MBT4515890.1 enoyl-CoA hydratase [Chloroflexota bacterium]MBT5320550.1 enoyl-CoA hydratase [Chloroflexota bacterium]MBT6682978.1 enoyl-CoA hydratase [Chloroflexota bacterium]
MPFEKIISETTPEGVLILTMNDPDTLNALGEPLMPELESEVDRFAEDGDLRVLVITGAGRSFSSGANVRGFQSRINNAEAEAAGTEEPRPTSWEELDPDYTSREALGAKTGPPIVPKLHNLHKPSFAAVNGHAYGLGCGIALSCDIRIAGESARFNEAFIRNGLVPADGSAWQLPKLVGMANALWMQYSGEPIDGNEAYRLGLANKVVPDDKLMETTLEMATRLARGPVYAMGIVKQLIHQAYQQDLAEHLPLASRGQDLTRTTFDHKEGVAAFLEKRKPEFRGY